MYGAASGKLFLHVGFPKTATTTLQRHLFAQHDDLCYLGKPFSRQMWKIERQLLRLDSEQFQKRLDDLKVQFVRELPESNGRPILLSHEGFLRNTRYGGHDWRRTAERLRSIAADSVAPALEVHILITLRDQAELVLSHFLQFINRRQSDLNREIEKLLKNPRSGIGDSLYYDEVLDHYAGLFGADRIHVCLFSTLQTNESCFINELSKTLGINPDESAKLFKGKHEKRRSRSSKGYTVNRRSVHHFISYMLRKLRSDDDGFPANGHTGYLVNLSADQAAGIRNLYRLSNKALWEKYGICLQADDSDCDTATARRELGCPLE